MPTDVSDPAPGPILTERLEEAGEEWQRQAGQELPMQRIGRPAEVAAAAVWLCSDQASFITGTTMTIDGGKLAGTPNPMKERRHWIEEVERTDDIKR
jgi:NAD(P)-dependent dehydrogenase (short-subunit alcohol dehydrogenase family)